MGVIRMILIIIGVMVALRFLGQVMTAKRNILEQNKLKSAQEALKKQQRYVEKNKGKTSVISNHSATGPYEDVDFVEIEK